MRTSTSIVDEEDVQPRSGHLGRAQRNQSVHHCDDDEVVVGGVTFTPAKPARAVQRDVAHHWHVCLHEVPEA